MTCRGILWFICIFAAFVTAAANYTGQDTTIGSDHEVTVHHLSTDKPHSSTVQASQDVNETTAVDLGALLDAWDGSMVTLVAGDTRLAAHRAVLAARSPIFAAMFHRDMPEASSSHITIPDLEGPVLRQLLAYMYTLQAPRLPGMATQLLVAADKYGLSGLKAACEQQLARELSVENAVATALLALRHSCPSLMQATVAFIKAHTHQVVMTQGWADAVVGQPHHAVELTRLIAELPAETSLPAATESGPVPRTGCRPHTDHRQIPVTAARSTLDEDTISHMRNLSGVEKGRRLIKAAMTGEVEELQSLLAAGADVRVRDEAWSNWTALHWAADRGHVEAVKCLLAGGAELGARTSKQNTALHLAAWSGHAAVVRQLLVFSVDPNIRGENGKTPLHLAARWGNTNVALALLEAGADSMAKDNGRYSPQGIAAYYHRHQMVQMLTPR